MPKTAQRNLGGAARIVSNSVKSAILTIVVSAAALAQVYPGGGYPGTGYPGSGNPGRSSSGIPLPGRTGKSSKVPSGEAKEPLPSFRGNLKVFDDKAISLEMGDQRIIDFRRNDKTKFIRGGEEVKKPQFALGDQVSVEAQTDPGGQTMTAVTVYWEKAAGVPAVKSKNDDGVVDTWKDEIKTAPPPPSAKREGTAATSEEGDVPKKTATAVQAVPIARDPEDPGPPKLKRGGVADPAREKAPEVPEVAAASVPERPAERVQEAVKPGTIREESDETVERIAPRKEDPLIRRSANAALDFTEGLPNYMCLQTVARSQSETKADDFRPLDIVSMEVVFNNGKEEYRNIRINGSKTVKRIEDTGGVWSTGEFGTMLIDLFSPATGAEFHYRGNSRASGKAAKRYDFNVAREGSHWTITSASQSYKPAYSGSVWIDPDTARVLRIEKEARGLPEGFPMDHVESAVDYQYVRLGDVKQYLLPVHAEALLCQRGTSICSKEQIDFRNYHKYAGESTIDFGDAVKDKK